MLEERFNRRMDKNLDRMISHIDRRLDELWKDEREKSAFSRPRETYQRSADLLHQAQQPYFATEEAGVESDTKTRKRTEGVTEDQAKHGDSSSARVDDGTARRV